MRAIANPLSRVVPAGSGSPQVVRIRAVPIWHATLSEELAAVAAPRLPPGPDSQYLQHARGLDAGIQRLARGLR
jgi:hypothetical protein